MLITRITLRVITGYITLDYIIIIRKLIFVNQWSERREHFIPQKGRLLVNSSRFIVLTDKMPSFLTYNSTLPLEINSNKQCGQYEMKICNWKAILLTLKSQSSGIGFFKRELLIEPKDNNDFERLKKSLNNWC